MASSDILEGTSGSRFRLLGFRVLGVRRFRGFGVWGLGCSVGLRVEVKVHKVPEAPLNQGPMP